MAKRLFIISGLFFILAIINPNRYIPITSFLSQSLAFIAVFCSAIYFLNKKIYIPYILLPLGVIIFVPVIQYVVGQVYYLQNSLLPAFYLLMCLMVCALSYSYCKYQNPVYGQEKLMQYTSCVIAIAGVISSIYAVCQWLHINFNATIILNLVGNRPYANLEQPNLLSTLLIASFISLLYLFLKNRQAKFIIILLMGLVLFSVILTQSRTAWIVSILLLIYFWIKQHKKQLSIERKCLISWFALYWMGVIFLPDLERTLTIIFPDLFILSSNTVVERSTTGYLRLNIWQEIIYAISLKPWTGYGWMQTASAQYAAMIQYPHSEAIRSAHNIILDVYAWTGLVIGTLIIGYWGYLYFRLMKLAKNLENICAFAIISAILVHAMLEFPLFYAYFLIIIAILVGLILSFQTKNKKDIELYHSVKIIYTLGIAVFCCTFYQYYHYTEKTNWSFLDRLNLTYQFTHTDFRAKITEQQLNEYQKVVESLLYEPYLVRYALMLAYNGKKEQAIYQLQVVNALKGANYTYEDLIFLLGKKQKIKEE